MHTSCGKRRNYHATDIETALTSIGSYKETFKAFPTAMDFPVMRR
jgi:hypothetical protein